MQSDINKEIGISVDTTAYVNTLIQTIYKLDIAIANAKNFSKQIMSVQGVPSGNNDLIKFRYCGDDS